MTTPDVDSPTSVAVRPEVASYLARLRAELSDLPATEVEEILEDVGPHVAEVADELAGEGTERADLAERLAARLGGPERYAAELRAAAGYPERDVAAPKPRTGAARFVLWSLVTAVALALYAGFWSADMFRYGDPGSYAYFLFVALALTSFLVLRRLPRGLVEVASLPEVTSVRSAVAGPWRVLGEYARLLQPGWWLVRAGIATVMSVSAVLIGLPWLLGAVVFGVGLLVGSVWLGRQSRTDRRWLWLVLPLNALLVSGAAYVVMDYGFRVVDHYRWANYEVVPAVDVEPRNVYVFDSEGNYIPGAYLFDQDGRPFRVPYQERCGYNVDYGSYPDQGSYQYPVPQAIYGDDGQCVERTPSPPAVFIPGRNAAPPSSPVMPTSPPSTVTTVPTR